MSSAEEVVEYVSHFTELQVNRWLELYPLWKEDGRWNLAMCGVEVPDDIRIKFRDKIRAEGVPLPNIFSEEGYEALFRDCGADGADGEPNGIPDARHRADLMSVLVYLRTHYEVRDEVTIEFVFTEEGSTTFKERKTTDVAKLCCNAKVSDNLFALLIALFS